MKSVILSFLVLLIFSCDERSNPAEFNLDSEMDKKLMALAKKREYFELRDILAKYPESISPFEHQYFSAFVQNAFNQNALSNITISSLLRTQHRLPDSLLAELIFIQRDNYIKMFAYKDAAESGKKLAEKAKEVFDERKRYNIENKNIIYDGLVNTLPQKTVLKPNAVVKWTRDKVGLMAVPVTFQDTTHDFIFDTRAGISVIMKSYAEKLKLRMPGVRYLEGSGITGKTFEAELGIADSLMIGDIKIYNVVFQVLPDEILSFPSMAYAMKGIIGFPVIVQWRRFQIHQNGFISVLNDPDTSSYQNLAFDESAMVLHTRADNDTLSFYVDSGANHSELFYNYFRENDKHVKQVARIDYVEVGGVGGLQKKTVYTLPGLSLQINNKKAALKDIQVLTSATYPDQKYYGNLGQDLLSQFNTMTFDFEFMSLSFQ